MENSMGAPQKLKIEIQYNLAIPFWVSAQMSDEITGSNRYLHPHLHYGIIHQSHYMETTECLSLDKENGCVCMKTYNGILFR